MQREQLPKHLKEAVSKFARAHEKGREATNEANRIKTELRNTVKAYWTEQQLPIGSFIRSEGMEIRYEANETTSLDAEAVFAMYEKKEITREQLLRMVFISRSEAKNVLGADMVADLEVTTVGDKLDIRIENLPVEQAEDEYVAVQRNVRKKIKRSVFGKAAAAAKEAPQQQSIASPKRRIKTRGTK
jgi:ribosomal protein S20